MNSIPYPGLRPFTHKEASIFFGREDQTKLVLEKLFHTGFVSVIGPSGCGKSSLVRAGVVAALKDKSPPNTHAHWWVGTMRPGMQPLRNLARVLLRESLLDKELPYISEEATEEEETILTFLRRGPSGLMELLREDLLSGQIRMLLVIDHFEDLFRYSRQGTREEIEAFVALLLASAQQNEFPIYVITTMRTEFVGECTLLRGLAEVMNGCQYLVPSLRREQQQRAIVEPVRLFGGAVEPHLVDLILGETEKIPHQLPLLQYCLMRMWRRAKSRTHSFRADAPVADELIITPGDYHAVGGVKNALPNHADETFWKLTTKQKELAKQIFRCLGERRFNHHYLGNAVRIDEIASIVEVSVSEVMNVIEIFRSPEHCFLTPTIDVPLNADSIIAFSHEALIWQWHQLKRWIDLEAKSAATYRHLVQTARLWEQGKASLWHTPDIENGLAWYKREEPTEAWAKRYGSDFTLALRFLKKSAKKKQKRLFNIGLISAAGLICVISLVAWVFWERTPRIRAGESVVENAGTGEFHIRRVELKDMKGFMISAVEQRYLVNSHEKLIIETEIDNPSNRKFTMEYYSFATNKAISEATYLVPDGSEGGYDVVVIQALDADTGDILDQEIIKIKIVATHQQN